MLASALQRELDGVAMAVLGSIVPEPRDDRLPEVAAVTELGRPATLELGATDAVPSW